LSVVSAVGVVVPRIRVAAMGVAGIKVGMAGIKVAVPGINVGMPGVEVAVTGVEVPVANVQVRPVGARVHVQAVPGVQVQIGGMPGPGMPAADMAVANRESGHCAQPDNAAERAGLKNA
jgi:hypothetical protein